ncbi:hypothetical protein RBH26_16395 [Natronolimnohabitans sp. A-GB9]|uniref:hypothetical protein n=1 Tax=Natronolimnohabitans sp. A-GB9 TaxID=3069757 RepID=UPI0027B27A83|nr:hypothetical protein [Natronolimnohabitans sp. A-GB9]MDQ2052058.1 hypothetical protein [Natronolimnohabitans sp. A-GB9]
MSVKGETEAASRSTRRAVEVVSATFGVVVLLAAVSYSVIVNVVNWITIDVLMYPVQPVAPFVVISGAILTIPILIPTVLVSVKLIE